MVATDPFCFVCAQCRELTTALTAAHIEGPLRLSNAEDGDALAAHCEKWTSSVRGALGQLVAWSHDAKVAALDAGLLGATIESLHTLQKIALGPQPSSHGGYATAPG